MVVKKMIPFSGYLRYDPFKQNLKSTNYINQILEILSDNVEEIFSSYC